MGKYFGTDGIRGTVNVELNSEIAYKIGRFIGYYFSKEGTGKILLGRDTRKSGIMLESALIAGITSQGANAYTMGVTTTPSLAYITSKECFDAAIMISASHNKYTDNGIKILNKSGAKLEDEICDLAEKFIDGKIQIPFEKDKVGTAFNYDSAREKYKSYLVSLGSDLSGYKIGIDSANGSGHTLARDVFCTLGASVYMIGDEPNGQNINEGCGSTHIEALSEHVVKNGLDFGFALDGDGDRCIAVCKGGSVIDGDAILYILARSQGLSALVCTVMSNSGLIASLNEQGIRAEISAVGDKNVYDKMCQESIFLGGEQSGHIILNNYLCTGDGILSAIMLSNEIARTQKSLCELCTGLTLYPQKIKSVRVKNKEKVLKNRHLLALNDKICAKIGNFGRVLLRASGTENVIRVMVECPDESLCQEYLNLLCEAVQNAEDEN